jgi:predicted acetylornithine/succinylornithine family transaminase
MTARDTLSAQYKKFVIPTYAPTLALVKGRGARVWDADGKAYLDFAAGIAVQNVGHCHPKVVAAIQEQAARLVHVSNLYYNEKQSVLAAKLSALAGGGKCFFCNSGAEANEALIKLARLWGNPQGKSGIVTMVNSFHGRTLASLAATGQTKYQQGFEPLPEGFSYAEYNNLDSVRAAINDKTAAILVEAVQGEGGVVPATDEFLKGLRALCTEKNILLLFDEVQCGMGRTGTWFGFQNAGVTPDAFSLAKALGSGIPIGAIVASPLLADVFQPGKHASTFGGQPLACAAALATIAVIEEEKLTERAAQSGARLMDGLRAMAPRYSHITEVRGRGLMIGVLLDVPVKPLIQSLAEKGMIVLPAGETVLRLVPPLNIKPAEIDEALDMINEALAELHGIELPDDADA